MRLRNQRGAAGGVEVLPFAMLVFASGTLLVANAWSVIDAKAAVEHAAREAGRAHVEAPDPGSAPGNAQVAARRAFAGSGREPGDLDLVSSGGTFHRCAVVEYRATYLVAVTKIPFIGDFGESMTVTGTHREALDRFGSATSGDADCG